MTRRRTALAFVLATLAACATQPWQQVSLTSASYDNETASYAVAPTNGIRTRDFDAPTPDIVAGATTVTTPELRAMMVGGQPPVVIDVLGGSQTASLPGALWIPDAGRGTNLKDGTQVRLGEKLAALTGGDKAKPIVFLCLSKLCWLSHNAAVRAVALGYTRVYWYRGGRDAWRAAGLPLEPVARTAL